MMRRLLRAFGVVVITAMLVLVAGTVVPRPLLTGSMPARGEATREILVLSNPIHTDIAIPVDADLLARFGFLATGGLAIDEPGVFYLVFGWGGRAFYIETPEWAQLKPMPVLKALTLDRSVMHVERAGAIDRTHPAVTPLAVDEKGYAHLLQFIEESFAQENGAPVPIPGVAYGKNDVFFEARGHFNAFAGCNTWTSAALRQVGLTTGWWNPLPVTLSTSLRLHNDILGK
ncbi:TIGR02117 family protein [Rhizobium sp. 32-5/1]|uniref:TIGR02117 family protein n=1 Tax=Rhizobium sp. 32-5/1 TaxID=3019602 RepID=UPI00240D44E6|nr:TIGR02117 family protein [Rhizobium sp. 32-5/1]WEZ83540.1 TIGR02117 family protein [Rhizobium sp. 32-5/1]